MNPALSDDVHFESKGFMEAVEVTDFPIRDHKVILVIRRRRWTDVRTGKSFSIPISLDVACKGTRYSKEFGAFLKETYGDIPRDLTLSGFRDWDQLDHADSWLLFPENIGPHLAIDEASLSNGELYTFVTNRDRHAGDGSLVAVVSGTKAEDVIRVLKRIDEEERMKVKEVTLEGKGSDPRPFRFDAQDCFCRIPESPKGD